MIYLNYTNLDAETQERLLAMSKDEVQEKNGKELKQYAETHYVDFEQLLYEEAVKNLYSYQYVFNV